LRTLCASTEADIRIDLIIGAWVIGAEIIETGTAGIEVTEAIVVNIVEITAKPVAALSISPVMKDAGETYKKKRQSPASRSGPTEETRSLRSELKFTK
jgi:hypothetical protein